MVCFFVFESVTVLVKQIIAREREREKVRASVLHAAFSVVFLDYVLIEIISVYIANQTTIACVSECIQL